MLMITVDTENVVVTLRLDGRLAGLEARELERAWSAVKQPQQPMVLDLTGVTSVDAKGKAFLAQAHRSGDWLVGGVATRAVVGEIVAGSSPEDNASDVSGALRDRRIEDVHAVLGS
jgi:ABC-type transporter Mla MlaB component